MRAATMTTAINGFWKTRIWPVNPAVFNEHDFALLLTTDRVHEPTVLDPEPVANQGPMPVSVDIGLQVPNLTAEQYPEPVAVHCTGPASASFKSRPICYSKLYTQQGAITAIPFS